jgi:hypothetical protein
LFKFIKAARITTPPSTAPGFPSSGPDAPVKTSELEKYMAGGNNNDAALFGTLFKGVKQQLPDGKELVEMGTGVNEVFRRVLPKWARAFHYLETREILPPDQAIYGRHFTVPDLQQGHGPQGLLQICRPRQVKRGNKDLGAQFGFASAASPDGKLFAYVAVFRRAVGAWIFFNKDGTHRDDPAAQATLLPALRLLKN